MDSKISLLVAKGYGADAATAVLVDRLPDFAGAMAALFLHFVLSRHHPAWLVSLVRQFVWCDCVAFARDRCSHSSKRCANCSSADVPLRGSPGNCPTRAVDPVPNLLRVP